MVPPSLCDIDEMKAIAGIGLSCEKLETEIMGRGVSYGGGQSSLGYLFGSGEPSKPTSGKPAAPQTNEEVMNHGPSQKLAASAAPQLDASKQIPAGIQGIPANNYHRADGQNTGNFITDRPSTKVHATPGGGSSLNYLFGGGSN